MTDYSDDALARAIYGIADAKMAEHGKKLPVSEDVFSVLTALPPMVYPTPQWSRLATRIFWIQRFFCCLADRLTIAQKARGKEIFRYRKNSSRPLC